MKTKDESIEEEKKKIEKEMEKIIQIENEMESENIRMNEDKKKIKE